MNHDNFTALGVTCPEASADMLVLARMNGGGPGVALSHVAIGRTVTCMR